MAPSLVSATASVARLSFKRLVRGRKLRLAGGATGFIVLVIIAARYAADAPNLTRVMQESVNLGFFSLLAFLVPFLLNSGSVGEEVEARTMVYLTSRPAGRWAIALGKYAAGAATSIAILMAGLVLLHVGLLASSPAALVDELAPTLRTMGAVALLSALYSGICMFWSSLVPEAAGIIATLHLAVVEFAFSFAPGIFRYVSMNYWATQLAGLKAGGLMPELLEDTPTYPGLIAIVALTLLFIGLSGLVVRSSEFRHGSG